MIAVSLSGCAESVVPPRLHHAERVGAVSAAQQDDWNYVAMDVSTERGGPAMLRPGGGRGTSTTRIERTRTASGWTTQIRVVGLPEQED